MIFSVKNYFWSRWLAKYHCKFSSGISSLGTEASLVIEEHVRLGRVKIKSRNLKIGAYTYLRSGSEVYATSEIGRFCSISENVLIGLERNKHPSNWLSTSLFSKDIERQYECNSLTEQTKIGNDCWIGCDALIMNGVTIGDGAIIGARALVTSDVPPFAIYAGTPAKLIRYRFPNELIEKILVKKWWNISIEYLRGLKMDSPELCVEQISNLDSSALAGYRTILVTKNGASLCN